MITMCMLYFNISLNYCVNVSEIIDLCNYLIILFYTIITYNMVLGFTLIYI